MHNKMGSCSALTVLLLLLNIALGVYKPGRRRRSRATAVSG